MASLPWLMLGSTAKLLDPELKKHSSLSIPYDKAILCTSTPFSVRNYCVNVIVVAQGRYAAKDFDSFSLDFREAVSVIREGGVESSSYAPLLQNCIENNSVSVAESLHAHMMKTGFYQELFLVTFLINVYAKCHKMDSAKRVFDDLPKRNVVAWTSLMSGYVYNSQPLLSISLFKEMLEVGGCPTSYTLAIVLNSCTSLCDILMGKQIHGYIVKYGMEDDAGVGNALCSLYAKCGSLEMAINSFNRINEKDVISWTSIISACGDYGILETGLNMFVHMLEEGVVPNEITLTIILSLCCTMQALGEGSQVHALCEKLGYLSDLHVTNSVMYLYLKNGRVTAAKKLFDGMSTVSLVAWNAMIAGYGEMTSLSEDGISACLWGFEALKIFHKMNKSGVKPDLFTFSSVLTVCSNVVALEQGEQVHAQVIKTGFLSDVVVGTSLVNMYSKCGCINRSSKAFIEMPMRTLVSWTSMINACAQHGRSQLAFNLFEDMRLVGTRPNKITFVGVLSACSQAGMVDQALAYYDLMINTYKINPVVDHHACIVDMFVRLGQIKEAFDFIKTNNVTPNEVIWSILIAGCRSHGEQELGFHVAEQLLELKPKDPEICYLLLDMHVHAGRWKDVSRIRKMMKDENIEKPKDWSWISIRNKVFSFQNPNKRNQSYELLKLLDDLLDKARSFGCEVDTSPQMIEEEMEEAPVPPAHHTEKLAIAFGLLNTSNAAYIRVSKSIGMCRSCHDFVKVVSKLESRIIIVRDSKRLHRFSDGHCSCGDFGGLV